MRIKHPNGFEGVLYGTSSMVILKDGEEVLHTGFRNVNTEEELIDVLEGMPEFMNIIEAERK